MSSVNCILAIIEEEDKIMILHWIKHKYKVQSHYCSSSNRKIPPVQTGPTKSMGSMKIIVEEPSSPLYIVNIHNTRVCVKLANILFHIDMINNLQLRQS